MKNIIIFLCILGNIFLANAQIENFETKHKIAINGAVTSDITWQLDFSYHYMLSSYVGIGTSLGMWREFSYGGLPAGKDWEIHEDDEKTSNLFLRPSIQLISPTILKISDGRLKLFLEPGLMMNIPYAKVCINLLNKDKQKYARETISSHRGRWYAFDCKIGVSLTFENIGFSAGYQISDIDIHAMRRNIIFREKHFNDFYSSPEKQHAAFLSVSYSF